MKLRMLMAFLLGAAAGGGKFAMVDAQAHEHGTDHVDSVAPLDTRPFVRDMDRAMVKMMSDMHAPAYTGNWDVDFLAMMIPHHQGAVDMAKLVLMHGRDPLTRNLAEEIIASQQVEIDAMNARLAVLMQAPAERDVDDFPPLSGTRGESATPNPQ